MKRILCLLITLFTFVGYQSNAQQIIVNIGSATGAIGDVVSIPVVVQLPPGSQTITNCQGAIILSDPSIAEIIGVTPAAGVSTGLINGGLLNFVYSQIVPISLPNGVLLTVDVKINSSGCSNLTLSNLVGPTSSSYLEFLVDGILYADLATDFVVNTGYVCSGCLCDLSNSTLGPISYSQNPNDCLSYYVSVPYITACSNVAMSETYNYKVFDSNGGLIADNTSNTNGNFVTFPGNGVYSIEVTYTVVENAGGCTQTLTHQEDFTVACGCSCDPNLLTLGAITFIPSTSDCSTIIINVPPVTGCLGVEVSRNYNFKIFNPSGLLIYDQDENFDGTIFPFNFQPFGLYTVVVTYSMTDDSGCTHELPPVTAIFDWTGCSDCQLLGPPTSLSCQPGTNYHTLFWTPVTGASSYEVEMMFNDPACCSGLSEAPSRWIFKRKSTSLNFSNNYCYSWRVRSVCDNGSKSAWSSSQCSCGTSVGTSIGSKKSMGQFEDEFEAGQLQLTAVPNPATNHVDITFSGLLVDMTFNQPEVIIYDMAGKVVYQSEITLDEAKRVSLNSFNSGIYIINITDNGSLLSTEKLIVQ